jgi:hypothetical protein
MHQVKHFEVSQGGDQQPSYLAVMKPDALPRTCLSSPSF